MKRILSIFAIIVLSASVSHAGLFMTADGIGAGGGAFEGALFLPGSSATEVSIKYTYGMNRVTDIYGRFGVRSANNASMTLLGGGAKSKILSANRSFPLDLAWVGDLSYITATGTSGLEIIGGVILSNTINTLTPYGIIGLSYSSYGSTSSSGIAVGGGVSNAFARNVLGKLEVLIYTSQGQSNTGIGGAIQYIL